MEQLQHFAETIHGLVRLGVMVGPTHFVLLACLGVNVFAANRANGARVDAATLARVFLGHADKLESGGP